MAKKYLQLECWRKIRKDNHEREKKLNGREN